jgi:hypothetical protein
MYVSDSDGWRLLIASPKVRTEGPEAAYKLVQSLLRRLIDSGVRLPEIWLVKDTEPMLAALRAAVPTTPDEISSIRLRRNTASGLYFDDAYIYRSS